MLKAFSIPYSAKRWRSKILANLQKAHWRKNFGEPYFTLNTRNVGEIHDQYVNIYDAMKVEDPMYNSAP